MTRLDDILDRALAAEDRAEKAEKRVVDLEARLRAALDADPTTAIQALSWVNRAEQGEVILRELLRYIDQRSVDTRGFPSGWVARARAQLKAVEILKRDQAQLAERPPEDDYWVQGKHDLARFRAGEVKLDLRRKPP